MNQVSILEGADRFEELIELAEAGKLHAITDNGEPVAVMMSIEEYSRLAADEQN